MNNQEINEYLAEHLFGLSTDIYHLTKHYYTGNPDYISNWQAVVEKLCDRVGVSFEILKNAKNENFAQVNWFNDFPCGQRFNNGYGDSIGEAVCRAAVEYLKAR